MDSQGCRANDPWAQLMLANRYLDGRGVPKDSDEGLKWCLESAKQEYATAECKLGWMYSSGSGARRMMRKLSNVS